MKDYIIVGLVVVIVLIILFRNVSGMTPAPSTAPPNCGPTKINKNLSCSFKYPGVYEKDGPITGSWKFCCA